MPHENQSQHESERLQKAIKTLEEKVDALEPDEAKDTLSDWSDRVRMAAENGEARIRQTVVDLSLYLDDPERFLAEKLRVYRQEVERIIKELPRKTGSIDIEALTADLVEPDEGPEKLKREEDWAKRLQDADENPGQFDLEEMTRYAAKEPIRFIEEYERGDYPKIAVTEALLEQTVRQCVMIWESYVLYDEYEFLHTRPWFDDVVEQAFRRIEGAGDPVELFSFITGMGGANSEFIRQPEVVGLLPKVFEEALLKNPWVFYEEAYTFYEKEPWFEETLEVSFKRLCEEKPIQAFDLLALLQNKPEFFEKPYVKERVPRLAEEVTQKGKLIALYHCDIYRDFYSEQDWKNMLTQTITVLSQDKTKLLALDIQILKDKLPPEVLQMFMSVVALEAPVKFMERFQDFQDIPTAQEHLYEAAYSYSLFRREPGTALRILHEDSEQKLPFKNRNEYIEDVALWAIEVNPTSAVTYFSVYEHLEDSQSLLERAQKRSLIAQNLGRTIYPSPEAAEFALTPEAAEFELMTDPAFVIVGSIERAWLPPNLSDQEFAEAAAMISRNLYLKNPRLPLPDEETCKAEYQSILETREAYKDSPLFMGRNVMVASHLEKWKHDWGGGKDRFGKQALLDAIQAQQGGGTEFAHYEPEQNTLKALKEAKQAILGKIESMPSPMTFLFDGHGGPDALYLSDGQVEGSQPADEQGIIETEQTIKITVDELSAALTNRSQRIGEEEVAKDILIFSACYNHTFLRSMYEKLEESGAGKPIVLGVSEFGQLGYSNTESPYGSTLFDQLIQEDKPTTLGDVWNLPYISSTNPSLYIPSNNTPQQVAENENPEQQRFAA